MIRFSLSRLLTVLCLILLSSSSLLTMAQDASAEDEVQGALGGALSSIKDKYDGLDNKGKAVVGAAVGFIGTRLLLKSALSAIKVGVIAVILAEVLDRTGILDVEETAEKLQETDIVQKIKLFGGGFVTGIKTQVRRRLNPANWGDIMEKEKIATLGAAGGIVLACLL